MHIFTSFYSSANTDDCFLKSGRVSILDNVINAPENYVNFSDDGKRLLAVMTLGISYLVIKLIEDHRQCRAQSEYVLTASVLLTAIDSMDVGGTTDKKIVIPFPDGTHVVLVERHSANGYGIVMEEKKDRAFHVGKYNERKVYINKTLSEIKEILVSDIINNKYSFNAEHQGLIQLAEGIKKKQEDKEKENIICENIKLTHKETHPLYYDEKSVSVKLREQYQPGYVTLSFFVKELALGMKKHLVLGVVTSQGEKYILSQASGKDRNLGKTGSVRYVKLNIPHENGMQEIFDGVISALKGAAPENTDFMAIIKKINPDLKLPMFHTPQHVPYV